MLHDLDLVSVQEVRTKVDKAHAAFQQFRGYTQEQVDIIVEAMAAAGRANARRLAEMAVEETAMGNVESKVAKNLLCADLLPRRIRGMKTIGLIRKNEEEKVIEIAEPVGVVAATPELVAVTLRPVAVWVGAVAHVLRRCFRHPRCREQLSPLPHPLLQIELPKASDVRRANA